MKTMSWKGIIEQYRAFLPVTDRTPVVTLGEGNTPLVRAERLRAAIGIEAEVYLKYEGLNPTGSFKDRGMTLAITKAAEEGARAVICASTGNTSASAAAYATRAGLRAYVLIPEGKIALGKLAQAMIHGAQVLQIEGNFDQALQIVRRVAADLPIVLVNSVNPYRIEGQKSGAFEVCDRLGRSPDYHFIPVGNGGNITAYWKGYQEYLKAGRISSLPKMMGWQAEGAAPIVLGRVVEQPETIATAIRIGNPASWNGAVAASAESGGQIDMVSDSEIIDAYRLLASMEGVFCELASASSVAGLIKYCRSNRLPKDAVVVCVLTGHGLKEPDAAIRLSQQPVTVKADPEAVLKLLSV
ncbi:MAG: threonine synthase [Candidatus Methylomirabilis oxygeniifera]|uniref:Threonine synthase n=1 Tax=Methylomirabilis oxygeniifera TaxID=671143 RepID=D5MKL6_METO1|nr:MAG: threonine synthase [Candidatus Methylomirabilis oxyfera]CBE67663.1 Threonine synthase [Candidatus Methylomirabilis oxyfera]